MQFEKLHNGDLIPKLGLGTWRMGGDMARSHTHDLREAEGIRVAVKLGYTHIDTAEMYGAGHAEELICEAVRQTDRERLFITSKVWSSNLHYQDVLKALEGSLKRLGTSYLDMYLIHWPNPIIPLEDTFRALNELVARGKVRHIGVANFDLEQLERAKELATVPLATDQVHYSLLAREPETNGVLRFCEANGILLTAYKPLEKGTVTGHPVVVEIARKYGVAPAQVALKWLIDKPGVITIPKAVSGQHLEENLGALNVELVGEDTARLDALS
jgi:diketogulonate reductase-like aldo/keto reductase